MGWRPSIAIPDQATKASPTIASFDAGLHMVHLGNSSNNIWHSTTSDGYNWTQNVQIVGQASKAPPALAAFDGRLHMVHLGNTSNQIWYSQLNPVTSGWLVNVPVPMEKSRLAPSLAEVASRLVMAHIGETSNRIWVGYTDGVPLSEVQLSLKILRVPTRTFLRQIDQAVRSMQLVYGSWGFTVEVVDTEFLDIDQFDVVDVGSCTRGDTTGEQDQLFRFRREIGDDVVAAYFVLATNPPFNGCAAHPDGIPACVVASGATQWTLGHEVGHVLGLSHVNDNDRLMTGNGTAGITNLPPDLSVDEAVTMARSDYTVEAL